MQPIIQLNNITAAYDNKIVVENANLTVYEHDYLGVIGPNGGGKTTLMKVMLGLMKPKSGEVIYLNKGKKVKEITIGYLPQYNVIDKNFPISIYEVVLSGLSKQKSLFHPYTKEQHQMVAESLEYMELSDFAKRPIGSLSGGQIQRVLLARAMVSKPDVVILDEPNTYIDKHFQEQMYEMLEEINKQCAIVIVSHDIAEILNNVKHVVCVNKRIHYHDTTDVPREKIEEHFKSI
jgi:zinc transport system ATP-binding protein